MKLCYGSCGNNIDCLKNLLHSATFTTFAFLKEITVTIQDGVKKKEKNLFSSFSDQRENQRFFSLKSTMLDNYKSQIHGLV